VVVYDRLGLEPRLAMHWNIDMDVGGLMETGNVDGIPSSRDATYFGYYGMLTNQQNMLEDSVRTGAYKWAISQNPIDFEDQVVLDVGTGTGILSFFSVHAGAKLVYSVEASRMADIAKILVYENKLSDRIKILHGRVEDVDIGEKVDLIVSEPMGVLLLHERMIESFITARDRFLRPGGKMFPSEGSIFLAPFTDHPLYLEWFNKLRFWENKDFHGIDLSSLSKVAKSHIFGEPIVGFMDSRTLMSAATEKRFDFSTSSISNLQKFSIPLTFELFYTGIVHGLAGWFDVTFNGTNTRSFLSTSPYGPATHWQQIRFLFVQPIAVNAGQKLIGTAYFCANEKRSYDIRICCELEGTTIRTEQIYKLDEQQYHLAVHQDPQQTPQQLNLYPANL
jgi:type I protein arginine methyltransferase